MKVENGKTFVRQGMRDWQEKPDFSADGIAPQGDFMAFLAAVRDVKANAPEQRAGIHFTRYSFTINGPAFAIYIRDRMEELLRAKGELPSAMQLDIPTYYRDMTGDGELWIGENGLPLRQLLTLQFPEQKDQQVHAQITVNFSNFGKAGSGISQWLQSHFGVTLPAVGHQILATQAQNFVLFLTLLTLAAGLCSWCAIARRAQRLYNSVVVAIIASIVLGPVLTTRSNVRSL